MPDFSDGSESDNPLGMTGEADWETLLDYTGGEPTEEVIRSWWAGVPVASWPQVSQKLDKLDTEDPTLSALIRRVTGL
jgi:hypothetical protein